MRVLIADDHDLVRDTIAAFLNQSEEVVADTADTLQDALSKISVAPYDLVLLDYAMPGMDGLTGLRQALAENGPRTVAILSGNAPRGVVKDTLAAGGIGFLPKTLGAGALLNAIRLMASGETFVPVAILQEEVQAPQDHLLSKLSTRERQVLEGLCKGLSNKEIARDLDVQEVTIKLHVKAVCRKLDAKNRTQAAMTAREAGFTVSS